MGARQLDSTKPGGGTGKCGANVIFGVFVPLLGGSHSSVGSGLRTRHVDIGSKLGDVGKNRDAIAGHRQKASVDGGNNL